MLLKATTSELSWPRQKQNIERASMAFLETVRLTVENPYSTIIGPSSGYRMELPSVLSSSGQFIRKLIPLVFVRHLMSTEAELGLEMNDR